MTEGESYIVKRKDPLSDIILSENKEDLAKFFDEPFPAIVETITGALATGPTAWMPVAGHIVQAALKGKLFQQISRGIKDLRERDKIDDFAERELGYRSWVELFKIIDEEAPEGEKLEALKALFYGVNKVNATDAQRIVTYQLFQIAKRLNSGAFMLLKACFEAKKANDYPSYASTDFVWPGPWAEAMARRIGHGLSALVLRDERVLMEQGLISPYGTGPQAGMVPARDARLTDLGLKFCAQLEDCQVEMKAD